eukprot:scaffold4457_cov94-Isochrysis_galbana.AAC.2
MLRERRTKVVREIETVDGGRRGLRERAGDADHSPIRLSSPRKGHACTHAAHRFSAVWRRGKRRRRRAQGPYKQNGCGTASAPAARGARPPAVPGSR